MTTDQYGDVPELPAAWVGPASNDEWSPDMRHDNGEPVMQGVICTPNSRCAGCP